MRKKGNRYRVLGLRLWDDQGVEWAHVGGLVAEEVDDLLAAGAPLVVHGHARPMEWVPDNQRFARRRAVRPYLPVRGETWGRPDTDGRAYSAELWRRDGDQLVGVEVHC